MRKEMNLESFDLFEYIKHNVFKTLNSPYILVDNTAYKTMDIRFPIRNFYYGIGLTSSGSDRVKIAHHEYIIQKGSLILIGPGVISQWMNESPALTDTILFTAELFKNSLNATFLNSLSFFLPGGNHIIQLNTKQLKEMASLFEALKTFPDNRGVVEGLVYSILMLSNQVHETELSHTLNSLTRKQKLVREFQSLVAQHFLKQRTVEYYAREMHITPKYLSEVLLAEVGKPAKYLIDQSVFLEAKTLLRQTTMTVQEISHWLDFADVSNFTKAFKKRESVTPLEYRKFQ